MTEEEELLEFQNKLWNLIRKTSPPDESKSNILMVSGALLSACLKLYVETIGKESTIGMFNVAIQSVKDTEDKRVLH
jgi:hypothetical protein|tara:strand:+ start:586 stop:816 length:231 start_codon:yes stop_codon:yes gene_type:complete